MAFGLRLRKIDKQEVDRRVENAARILGLDQLLDKNPGRCPEASASG